MNPVEYGQIISAVYLKISVSDFLTLFAARTGTKYFWQIPPAPILFTGACFALTLSSLLSIFWPESEPDGIPVEGMRNDMGLFGFVWIYCLIFFFIQDAAKVLCYRTLHRTNFNGIATTGVVVFPESTQKLVKELREALSEEALNGSKGGHH
jgi:H+-transporting ATPase